MTCTFRGGRGGGARRGRGKFSSFLWMKMKKTCRVERKGVVDVDDDDDGVGGGRGVVVAAALLKRCQKHCQKEFLIC